MHIYTTMLAMCSVSWNTNYHYLRTWCTIQTEVSLGIDADETDKDDEDGYCV